MTYIQIGDDQSGIIPIPDYKTYLRFNRQLCRCSGAVKGFRVGLVDMVEHYIRMKRQKMEDINMNRRDGQERSQWRFSQACRWGVLLLTLIIGLGWAGVELRSHASATVRFNRDIRPILSDKCYTCHGPDASSRKSRLRLDSEAGAKAELGGGRRAITPGDPERSELVLRIRHTDPDLRMPPTGSNHSLTPTEIDLLTEWIRQGAQWESHWAFIAPVRPDLPQVRNKSWVRNEIDHFVLARLEQAGLQPAPEADRATLLRRVTFDLTGLPPTIDELDTFIRDKSPDAWEKAVDRLLASPRFGERMAFEWLDAARYADTNGYQIDGERFMWRWRDWVINAFNRDLPFDRFTIEQLAGDMLPNPTLDQRIATAFNRNHRLNSEDGIVADEYLVEYIVDRVDTTSTVFLGLTMGCARCHNHKFDPISQKDYYQLYAYFNSIPEDGRAHNYGNSPPWISAPTSTQQQRLADLDRQILSASRRFDNQVKLASSQMESWARQVDDKRPHHWFPGEDLIVRHSLDRNAPVELIDTVDHIDMSKPNEKLGTREKLDISKTGFRDGNPTHVTSPLGEGVEFDGRICFDAGNVGNFNFRDRLVDYKDQFAISAWFRAEQEQSGTIVSRIKDIAFEKDNNLPKARGYGLFLLNGKLHFNIVGVWADDSWRVETVDPVGLQQWHHVVAVFDSTLPYEKARIYLDGKQQSLKINNGRLFRTFNDDAGLLRIGGGGGPEYRFRGEIDEVRIYKSALDDEMLGVLACADSISKIATIPPAKRSRSQQLKLVNSWVAAAAPEPIRSDYQKWRQLLGARRRLESQFPTVMVMQELPAPRPTSILRRGAYDMPGDPVARALPALLTSGKNSVTPANRLEFARWLVGEENPLTARVTVNRFWQMLFGAGLVRSVEDFGLQGELPSHPELLDWLAIEFREGRSGNGRVRMSPRPWSIKSLLRKIVTSATYRQSSKQSATSSDPENRLLARAPRLRLSAEMIRDQALAASGLLVERIGGPSVKPYQPPDLLKDMVFSNMTTYGQEKGDGLWRRSLYTYWKRTVLNPTMLVFDASAREQCSVRETRTNTPLQALNLMNDVTYLEAARLLAERALSIQAQPRERLTFAFRAVTSRYPSDDELRRLEESLAARLAMFQNRPEEAKSLLAIGEKRSRPDLESRELAAYTVLTSLILNLDESITRP